MYDTLDVETKNRVSEQLEYWSGTMHCRLIQRALDESDSEALAYHLVNAEREQAMQEDYQIKVIPKYNSALVNLRSRFGDFDVK